MSESGIEKKAPLRLDKGAGGARRSRGRGWLYAGLAAVLLVGAGIAKRALAPATVEVLTVAAAYPYQGVTLLNATGYVVAQRKAAVGSKASGRLEWLGVREGSVVKAGEVLARIESKDVEAQARQAEANVGVARASQVQAQAELFEAERLLRRARDLADRNYVSVSALDEAEARAKRARAAVTSAEAAIRAAEAGARAANVSLDQTNIRAPFDGVVLTKSANVGDIVTTFSAAADSKGAVVTMADMATLEVEADVSESVLGKVRIGQPCEIQLDAFPDMRFRGEVIRIVPTVDRSKASVMTKIRFLDRDERILPEMSAKVAFLSRAMGANERNPRVVVHKDALVGEGAASAVFRIDQDLAHRVAVTRGAAIGDQVEVSVLKAGDRVVRKPADTLKDGARVEVSSK
ncbi:efflux RND transporter periplasmic adaptor subunit [Niveibacterium umoris]|uniref:RND family efflux transporter MFP subunit n=1 Tax=Niveibacterium umoris TaxID=1193620 RepID=A0A840BL33_9RHOO|nr:efflux RND transporter periplasmic adaptor subunit [Niveibacterium umoris]MBB4012278.1 RND family efflux transporter MFP subunit [Niveibacterium umoris]